MKKIIFGFVAMLFSVFAFAQQSTLAQEATDELVETYGLSEKQSAEMLVIQERQVRNLAEIESLKNEDIKKYRHKRRSIQQGTDASIRRILTEEQMKVYHQNRLEWRKERAERIADMKQSGMSMEEIEDTLLEEGY